MSPRRPRVYVLYTGGTIGCAGSPLAPLNAPKFAQLVSAQPGFQINNDDDDDDNNTLTLDVNVNDEEEATIDVVLDNIEPAIDSSSMTPNDWVLITRRILENIARNKNYTGIVVLHGTDTLAYSSSAVSYLLGKGVSKPVIFTGSQVPLSKTRNDAQRNLISSITLAATQTNLNEVAVFFDSSLLRGNRAVKMSSSAFPAFHSPNHPDIGKVGIEIDMEKELLLQAPPKKETLDNPDNVEALQKDLTELQEQFKTFSVVTVTLHPGIQASTVKAMLSGTTPPVKGLILQAFGAGNAPADDELIRTLKAAHDEHGVVLCDITQIVSGGVDLDAYESAAGLRHAGCISGYDLTCEAALAKLTYLIGKGYSQQKIEDEMKKPFQNDLSAETVKTTDAKWKTLLHKRGHGAIVHRLRKKRDASKIST